MGQRLLLVDTDRGFLKDHQVSLEAAFDAEVLDKTVDREQRRCRPATVVAELRLIERCADDAAHCLTSIAERKPSDKRLNEIDVRKIIKPGNAATIGWL